MSNEVAKQIFEAVMASCAASQSHTVTAGAVHIRIEIGDDPTQRFFDVRWAIETAMLSRLIVAKSLPMSGRSDYVATRLAMTMPLILGYHNHGAPVLGTVNLSQEDYSDHPGLSFCSNRDDVFLIPDTDYIATRGYADFQRVIDDRLPAWSDRTPTAFWRGSTTGLIWKVAGWRDLPRLRLCAIAQTRPDLFDVGVSGVVQIEAHAAEIEAAGFLRLPVPAVAWAGYRYQIDVDGNSNAWAGYFQRLLTGSPVLKVASPFGFQQWFYRRMEPWRHYVPVAADMSDLIEKVEWLNGHERVAQMIGQEGQRFARSLIYEGEMRLAVLSVAAAVRAA